MRAIDGMPQLEALASTPLLVSAMALMQYNNVLLPDQRAQLYEELVRLLIDVWRRRQVADDTLKPGRSAGARGTQRRRLENLALEMLKRDQTRVTLHEAHECLRGRLVGNNTSEEDQREQLLEFLESLAAESGLIVSRADCYTFSHLTLQEYLAARACDGLVDAEAFLLQHANEQRWRETLLLALGHWSNGQHIERVVGILSSLTRSGNAELVLLACDALCDIGDVEELSCIRTQVLRNLSEISDAKTSREPIEIRFRAACLWDRQTKRTWGPAPWTDAFWVEIEDDHGHPAVISRYPITARHYEEFMIRSPDSGTRCVVVKSPSMLLPGRGRHPVALPLEVVTVFTSWLGAEIENVRPEWINDLGLPTEKELQQGLPEEPCPYPRMSRPVGIISSCGLADAGPTPTREWFSGRSSSGAISRGFRVRASLRRSAVGTNHGETEA